MSALEQALQQCAILYGKDTSHNEKQSADEWLKKFTHESEAWTVAPQLLSGDFDEQTFFYGALVLRQKIGEDFADLPTEAHDELRQALFGFVVKFADGPASVRNKLCAAVAALAIQMLAWSDIVADIIRLLPLDNASTLTCQLVVLCELSYEAHNRRLFVPQTRRDEVKQLLKQSAGPLTQHLVACMQSAGNNTTVQKAVFVCMYAWLRNVNFSLTCLVENPLVHAPFDAIVVPDLFDACVDVICELVHRSGKQLSDNDEYHNSIEPGEVLDENAHESATERVAIQQLATTIVPLVVKLRDNFVSGNVDHDDEEVFKGYTRIFTELGEYYTAQFIVTGSEEALSIVSVLLQCANHPDTDIFAVTSRFWYLLAREIDDDSAKKQIFGPAFASLLDLVQKHVTYASDYDQWDKNRKDDFLLLRKDGMTMALRAAADVLGGEAALSHCCDLAEHALQVATNDANQWRELESALYCVRSLARSVERNIKSSPGAARAMALVPQLPAHNKVQYQGLLIVGRYADWLNAPDHQAGLGDVLQFITTALQEKSTVAAAAVALNNVCEVCAPHLTSQLPSLLELYLHVAGTGNLLLLDAQELVEAIANVIKAVENPSDRREAMQKLCMPLAAAVEDPAASLTTIGYAFNLICSAFEYGSKHFVKRRGARKAETNVEDDPLFEVFEQLWPLFAKTLAERVHEPDAVVVCSRVIRYGARALPPHQMARVAPAIFEHITECFGQSPSGELLHVVGSLVGSLVGISMLEPVAPVLTKAFGFMGSVETVSGFPDVAQEVFMIGTSLLWSTPVEFVTSAYLDAFLECGAVSLQCDNPDVSRAVFAFLNELLTMVVPRGRASARSGAQRDDSLSSQIAPPVLAAMNTRAPLIVDALVTGLAGALPLSYCGEVAGVLRRMRRLDAEGTCAAMVGVLQSRLPNLDASHKEALVTALGDLNDNLFHACDAFATACRRRKRWIH